MIKASSFTQSLGFAIGTLLVAMLSIQSGASLAKNIFPLVSPQGATMLRLFFAALILGLFWRPWRYKISRGQLKGIIAYGTSLGVMNLLFYMSLERIPLGIAVALEFTGPLAVAFYSSRKAMDFLWGALAVAGILLIVPLRESVSASNIDPWGAVLALAAGACWAFYIIYGQRALKGVAEIGAVSAYGMLTAAIIAFPFGISKVMAVDFDFKLLWYALGIALLSSAIPYTLEMISLRRLAAKNFGILMSLEPAIAALSGYAFLKENLSGIQLLAIACIIAASVGSTATTRKSA